MLSRLVSSSVRSPLLRTNVTSSRIASSTQWTRGLASHKRGFKKPNEYSKQASPQQPSENPRPSSIGPQRSTAEGSAFGVSSSERAAKSADKAGNESSKVQDEISEGASTSDNTSQKTPEEPIYTGPLPDLTQGIPSTLEYETMGRTSRAGGLNVTEDPNAEETGSGGRPKGELPASAYISSSEKKRLKLANYMYASFVVFVGLAYVYLGRNWESEEEEQKHPEQPSGWSIGLMWQRAKARLGDQLNYYNEPAFTKLLPNPDPAFEKPYTLVISLEDMLVHSEWTREHGWRMAKRPGVDYFLRYLSQYYELVIFTTVPWAIGEPIVRKLDPYHIVMWPLYREATFYKDGEYVKDLSFLNRDLSKVILVDSVQSHAKEQPDNAIILPKWKGDPKDKELVSLIPFLEYIPTMLIPDVRTAIKSFEGTHIPTEFAKREAVARKKFQQQMAEEQKKKPKSGLGFLSNALGVKPMGTMDGEQSPAEAFAQGKMLQDQARERGQRNYEALEKMIREEGAKWLKEEADQEELAKQEGMKAMKSGLTGFFGVPGSKPSS